MTIGERHIGAHTVILGGPTTAVDGTAAMVVPTIGLITAVGGTAAMVALTIGLPIAVLSHTHILMAATAGMEGSGGASITKGREEKRRSRIKDCPIAHKATLNPRSSSCPS